MQVGCTGLFVSNRSEEKPAEKDASAKKPAGPLQVNAASSGLTLEPHKDTKQARGEFITRVNQLLADQRTTTARMLVQRHPDLSLEILQAPLPDEAKSAVTRFIAQMRDQQCVPPSPSGGWDLLFQDRLANPTRYAKYDEARAKLLELFRRGRAQYAADLKLASFATDAPNALLTIDAGQLTGIALQLAGRPAEAAPMLAQTAQTAKGQDIHQAAYLLLLLSDSERCAGQFDRASSSWQQATLLASDSLVSSIPIRDPMFWERATYLRPVKIAWPEPVLRRLVELSQLPAPTIPVGSDPNAAVAQGECALFACLGQWRYDRNEPQAALLAFKRAETCTEDEARKERLRFCQAKALFRLEQAGTATALLVELSKRTDSAIARPALALLGGMKLQSGNTQLGMSLLERALTPEPIPDWPERAEADADLGLAQLMLGDEVQGLQRLRVAQRRFEVAGQHDLLMKSLWNEARYLEHKGKHKDEVAAIENRLRSLESNPTMADNAGPQGMSR
jgi:hypothetical protein